MTKSKPAKKPSRDPIKAAFDVVEKLTGGKPKRPAAKPRSAKKASKRG
jgi:hypothetical protein